MPSWRKVIVSGSDASLNSLNVTSITGSLQGTSSFAITSSYAINAATSSYSDSSADIITYVKNTTGIQINKGTVVRITGATGDNALISTASYESDAVSANTLGITRENIANNAFGYVITEGRLLGIDTSLWTAGQLLFLGVSGSITGSAPKAPLHAVRLGQVLRVQQINGSMYVRIDNGYELDELHDVDDNTTTGSYGDLLVKSGSVWTNSRQLTGSYALTGSLIITGSTSTDLVRITQTGTGNAFVVEDSTTPDATPFVITNSGTVGIGTIAPISTASLHIKPPAPTTSGQSGIVIEANAGAGINLISDNYNTNQSVTTFGRLQSSMAAFLAYAVNQTGSNTTAYQSSQDAFATKPTALELGNGYFALKYNTSSISRTYGTTVPMATSLYLDGSSGRIGIGIQTPQAIFHVSSSGYGNETYPFIVGFNQLVVTASGNVGIGTTTPAANLEVYGTSDSVALVNSAGNSYLKLKRGLIAADAHISFDTTTTQKHIVGLINNTDSLIVGGTEASPVITISGSNVGIGTTTPSASLHITNTSTSASFLVEDDTNPDTTPFIIDTNGNVGMGTLTPQNVLHVKANPSSTQTAIVRIESAAVSANSSISYYSGGTHRWEAGTGISLGAPYEIYDRVAGLTRFSITTAGASVFSNGNVGIGTTNPSEKLHVSGNLLLSSSITTTININSAAVRTYIASEGAGTSFGALSNHPVNFYQSGSIKMFIDNNGGNTVISGSLAVGTSSIGPSENTITLGARDNANEGGQLGFNAPGGTYTSASFIDLYQNRLRVLQGTNAGSVSEVAWWSMHNKQMALPAYNSTSAFPGTAAGYLAFDSSGNIITTAGAGAAVNIGNTDLTITTNAARVLSHSGTSRFIISGSTSNSLLEYINSTTGLSRGMLMQQQLNGETNRVGLRAWTSAGNNQDSTTFNGWASDHIVEYVNGSGVAPSKLKGWGWSYYDGSAYKDVLLISTSNTATLSGSLTVTGSTSLPGTTQGSYGNVVLIDTVSGRLYYTSSNAMVDGLVFPYTGSALITGSLGITGTFNVTTPSITAATESLATFTVTDDPTSYFRVYNATTTNSSFVPAIEGKHSGTNVGLYIIGNGSIDSGTTPCTVFDSRIGFGGSVATRPLFHWRNAGSTVMTIDSNGDLGINTTTPNAKLDVNGNAIITGSLNVTTNITSSGLLISGSTNGSANLVQITQGGTGPALYTAGGAGIYGLTGLGQGYFGVTGENSGDALGDYIGVKGTATSIEFPDVNSEYIGGYFYANGNTKNYSVQLQDGTEGAGKVLVSKTATGRANWSTQLSGSYGLTGSLEIPSPVYPNAYNSKIHVANYPSPAGTLTAGTGSVLYKYGANNEGLILQYGSSGDQGGLKITDDGVAIFGAGDTDIFKVIDEDSNIQRFSINNDGRVGINKTGVTGSFTPTNATLDVNGDTIITGSLTLTSNLGGSGGSIDMNAMIQASLLYLSNNF